MSDTTYAEIVIERSLLTEDIASILDKYGFNTEDDGAPDLELLARHGQRDTVTYFGYEANYGGSQCTDELLKAGVRFTGHHDAGGGYNAMVFACDGKTYIESEGTEGPMIDVPEDCVIRPEAIAYAMEYWAVYKRAVCVQEVAQ